MKPTPHLKVRQIAADEFRRGANYYSWRPGGTEDWLLIYTLRGGGIYRDGASRSFVSREGDLTLYAPGALQHYATETAAGRWDLLWAHFLPRAHWQPWLAWPEKWRGFRTMHLQYSAAREEVVADMRKVVRARRGRSAWAGEFALNAMEKVLLDVEKYRENAAAGQMDERIRLAVDLLAQEFRRDWEVAELAKACSLSPSRFAHLFKEQTGHTPQKMLEENRMRHASVLLLSTALAVAEIGGDCGYESAFYFSQRFRLFFGVSPRAYREKGGVRRRGRGR